MWDEIKDEMEPQALVTITFLVELIFESLRDEMRSQLPGNKGENANYGIGRREDEIGEICRPP